MLSTIKNKASLRRPAWVSAEALNVAPDLLGAPLATPVRRMVAIGVDLALVGILSRANSFWLLVALAVFFYQLRARRRATLSWQRNAIVWVVCLLCLWLAMDSGKDLLGPKTIEIGAVDEEPGEPVLPSVPPSAFASAALASGPMPDASTLATPAPDAPASAPLTVESPAPGAVGAGRPAAAASPPKGKAKPSDSERIAALEAALAEAKKPHPFKWQTELTHWLEGVGVGFGWAIVYFSLVPAWLNGQSLGKKLLGLRVVELTGKPLTVMMCFSRYGGYVAGMATGMFGFAQVLWDDNRQALQDKVAHTVVVDLNGARLPPQATEEAADSEDQIEA